MLRPGAGAAVVVDEWPLVRIGMAQALRAAGIDVVAETARAEDGVRAAGTNRAEYLLLGVHRDMPVAEAVRRARALSPPPRVLVVIDHIGGEELAALRAVGVDALLARATSSDDLVDAVVRVGRGERVVAPALLTMLVGLLSPADDPTSGDEVAGTALTRKEIEVLARLAEGRSNRQIADAMYVTPATVKSHLAHIYVKLGVNGRQEAVAKAVSQGLLG